MKLIENVDQMVGHISKVYDFKSSDVSEIPFDQWWWHLDKIAKGTMNFGISAEKGNVM